MDILLLIILAILALLVYFLPTLIAECRDHHQQNAIIILNIFLGWTFLGWVVALAWSASAVSNDGSSKK